MPYIMSSTLRRMSTISNASSGHSTGSGSSDGNSSRPASQDSAASPRVSDQAGVRFVSLRRKIIDKIELAINRRKEHFKVDYISYLENVIHFMCCLLVADSPEKQPKGLNESAAIGRPADPRCPGCLSWMKSTTSLSFNNPLSPPAASRTQPRAASYTCLPSESVFSTPDTTNTPPPMPPKKHPHESESIYNSTSDFTPPLPSKVENKPPPPPPKTRKSMFSTSESNPQ
ncbi:hypothetical protein cypCar_00044579 [Cyprinus carpio]|nr:hypothetical protein cypCar_00044579 [Cyprinus carpio]